MANITIRTDSKGRKQFRALVRMAGVQRCATFGNRTLAEQWAKRQESDAEQLRSTGAISARDVTIATLIDDYVTEQYPRKPWGKSKAHDLQRLRNDLGAHRAATVNSRMIVAYFERRSREGTGRVGIAAACGYLCQVFEYAKGMHHLDVPVAAVTQARETLRMHGLAGASTARDRRVSDAELTTLCEHFADQPLVQDILRFAVASSMRISEICGLRWADFDETARTVLVRDRKHPSKKIGNTSAVPLLALTGYDALALIAKQPRESDYIFPLESSTVSTYVSRAVQELGLDFHLHDLRHEAISRFFAARLQIQEVALLSGHRSWQMLKRYTHVSPADVFNAIEQRS